MKRALALAIVALAPPRLIADEIHLRGGRSLNGDVVERTPTSIVLEVSAGRITLPLSHVEKIVVGASALAVYRDRARRLAPNDTAGWLELGLWAQERELKTQAREAFERVRAFDPSNPIAQRALGNVLLGERWMSPEESYRARGYVNFEGFWVTPEERDATLRERAAERAAHEAAIAAERARVEAEARAREAEARARAAEAEARRAEANLVYGGGFVGPYGPIWVPQPCCGRPHRSGFCPVPRIQPVVVPAQPPQRDHSPATPPTRSVTPAGLRLPSATQEKEPARHAAVTP